MADLSPIRAGRMQRRTGERGPVREFLAFVLAGELYGVELTRIREILSPPPLTPVPRAPPEVMGVCSVRGLLVTVIDLRRRLRLAENDVTRRARILLTQGESGEVIGLFVDEVRHVLRLGESEIESSTSVLGGDVAEHVLGIGRPDGTFMILLDLPAIVGN